MGTAGYARRQQRQAMSLKDQLVDADAKLRWPNHFPSAMKHCISAQLKRRNAQRNPSIQIPKMSSNSKDSQNGTELILQHLCGADAEALSHYVPGGLHPVKLGDTLDHGRYEILRKLGWGGFSTVWAARDCQEHQNVAVKIMESKIEPPGREQEMLKKLALPNSDSQHSSSFLQLLDTFQVSGPNGTHNCLVLELLGPSITDYRRDWAEDERIPGKSIRRIAKEVVQGIDYLHRQHIVHGDIHVRNISFSAKFLRDMSTDELAEALGDCESDVVTRKDGKPLGPGMAEIIVEPAEFLAYDKIEDNPIKISDFGESFTEDNPPSTLHTPLSVRPPEVIFGDKLDHRVDLWSLGCLIFELIAGNPPFNSLLADPHDIVQQMLESIQHELPVRWREAYKGMDGQDPDPKGLSFQVYLERCYFNKGKQEEFSREDIQQVGELIGKLLKLEPSERIEAGELLKDPWFEDSP